MPTRRVRAGMPTRRVRAEKAEIAGPAGALEALVETPAEPLDAVAVVCHPHPLHGGTMHNKVTYTVARAFNRLGVSSVRFNFRGVGASAGHYAEGSGELEDALAVVSWAERARPDAALYLGGFSFGAAVALRAAERRVPLGLVTVALPVARLAAESRSPDCRWLLVHGERDEIVPLDEVRQWLGTLSRPGKLVVVSEATHFFHGKLNALADDVTDFFATDVATRPAARSEPGHAQSPD
jgi:alpha/beta superfamily hydrolase